MGKKEGKATSKKRLLSEEEEEDEEEAELNRELAALAAMRAEKAKVPRAQTKKAKKGEAVVTITTGKAPEDNDDDDDNNYEDIDDDDDYDDDDDEVLSSNKPITTYNKEGLVKALEAISSSSLPFEETYAVCKYDVTIANENDDLEVEMAFYNQSLLAVKMGRQKLAAAKIPFKRPSDYFCEMLKTDNHMAKIKDKLISEEKRVDAFEKRRERENNKKYNKQVEELRKQEKTQSKDEFNSEIGKFKKRNNGKDGSDKKGREEAEEDDKIEKLLSSNAKIYKRKEDGDRNNSEKSKKRINMDKKYGLGGQEKKRAKLTDKKSLNDLSTYNPRGGKFVRREKGGKAKARPGKARRESSKGKR